MQDDQFDDRIQDLDPARSRFAQVSRRAFLTRAAMTGVAAALVGVAAACGGNDDASVLSKATTTDGGSGDTAGSTTTGPTTTTTGGSTGPAVAGGMVVKFTYTIDTSAGDSFGGPPDGGFPGPPGGFGGGKNPYIAVWVENADGELVQTIALWFLQEQKGLRYLEHMQRWVAVDGSDNTIQTISSATRAPGAYSLDWDASKANVKAGQYYICIESAREHGPYSLIRQPLTLDGKAFTANLTANGELSAASVQFNAA